MRRIPFVQPPPLALTALQLPAPPRNGIVSSAAAAAVHGLPLINGRAAWLTLPRGFHARHCEGWNVARGDIDAADITETADGFPVTSLRRTAIDCARTLPLYDAVAILDWVLNRELVPLADLHSAAAAARGRGAGALQRAVRLADARAESAQESVARVALGQSGLPSEPQFALFEGAFEHRYDLGLRWAKTLIDLQSRAHHSQWREVERDIGYLQLVNATPGWRLVLTTPDMLLPWPFRLVRAVLEVVVTQPGPRCRALRRRYLHDDGSLDLRRLTLAPAR